MVQSPWLPAKCLEASQELLQSDGSTAIIVSNTVVSEDFFEVFNFEVDSLHNYYVSDDCECFVLVHNNSLNQAIMRQYLAELRLQELRAASAELDAQLMAGRPTLDLVQQLVNNGREAQDILRWLGPILREGPPNLPFI